MWELMQSSPVHLGTRRHQEVERDGDDAHRPSPDEVEDHPTDQGGQEG